MIVARIDLAEVESEPTLVLCLPERDLDAVATALQRGRSVTMDTHRALTFERWEGVPGLIMITLDAYGVTGHYLATAAAIKAAGVRLRREYRTHRFDVECYVLTRAWEMNEHGQADPSGQ